MLHLNHFEKSYGTTPVISIPNFTLKEGVYWLQGENGAGKTTLLKPLQDSFRLQATSGCMILIFENTACNIEDW